MDWRQLTLLKGARQRGTRPAPPPEFALHCAVADLVARWIMPGWMYSHLPMGEHRNKATAQRLKRMGVVAGWPDFIFVGPHRLVFLELKRRGSHQSDEQANVAHHILRSGFDYVCVDNLDDALAALRDFGIVRARVSA
jgi:hypothetical protein